MDFNFLKTNNNTLVAGSPQASISELQSTLGIKFPTAFIAFLRFSDGCIINERIILFSCGQGVNSSENILNFNNPDSVKNFLRIGRFSEDEFGYKSSTLGNADPAIYIIDHETNETKMLASNLIEFLEKYTKEQSTQKKKWYSFLFS